MPKFNCLSSIAAQTKAQNFFSEKAVYEEMLLSVQHDLLALQQDLFRSKRKMIIVLEGSDTAGKGGLARRMAQYIDPRSFHVYGIGKPTQEELQRHYMQRFFLRLPNSGEISVFDRSWYGRVLVERVEGIAKPHEWKRAYHEINNFEKMLNDDGILILKYLLDISYHEQGQRFKEREKDPLKSWKMTEEDYRNRKKWDQYHLAFKEMNSKTSTRECPWQVVPADSKWFMRVFVLKDIVRRANKFLKKS
jgi:polyphosphate kinase 2 (PPK2 family)